MTRVLITQRGLVKAELTLPAAMAPSMFTDRSLARGPVAHTHTNTNTQRPV
jgi:hypothetical protein